MTTPHKWAEVIHAFAEGKEIQCRGLADNSPWFDVDDLRQINSPSWSWRIKPQKKTYWVNVYQVGDYLSTGNPYEDIEICTKKRNPNSIYIKTISFDIEE